MTTFVPNPDGSWRRDDERHDNVLIDTSRVPELLSRHGVDVELGPAFTDGRPLPEGLVAVTGTKR